MFLFIRWKHWIGWIIFIMILALGLSLVIGHLILKRSLPQVEGEIRAEGLYTFAEVIRDLNGVPHIIAQNDHDALFLQGYVHAQDRLWQMDILRRTACGELSEIFGTRTLDADILMRTIGLSHIAQKIADSLDQPTRQKIQWYCDGINAFLYSHVDNLPDEFVLLGYTPRHWEVIHPIAISRLVAWMLNMGWYVDGVYGTIIDSVGFQKARELFPETEPSSPVIVPEWKPGLSFRRMIADTFAIYPRRFIEPKDTLMPDTQNILGILQRFNYWSLLFPDAAPPGFCGSNNWVITGRRTANGKPILANDPHLSILLPSLWYENHLSGGNYHVTGFSIPGTPFVVIGNNVSIAWGFTNAMADESDLYRETVKDEQYLFNGFWRPLRKRIEIIRIRDRADTQITVYSTHRGAILGSVYPNHLAENKTLSLRWMGMEFSNEFKAFDLLNRAANWNDFRKAVSYYGLPAQNAVYADTAGNIGYQFMGKIPIRREGRYYTILEGYSGMYDWRGYADFDDLPYRFNPLEGYIATANNPVISTRTGVYVSAYWEPDSRIRRIREELEKTESFGIEETRKLQQDVLSPFAKDVLPYLLKACEKDTLIFPMPMEPDSLNFYQEAYLIMKIWDGRMNGESQGAIIYNFFFREWIRNTFYDEMGDSLFKAFTYLNLVPHRAIFRILEYPRSSWWDDRRTRERMETRDDIIRRSFTAAIDSAYARYRFSPAGWFWKEAHGLKFEHPLGSVYPLNYYFNQGQYPVEGNGTTIFKTEFALGSQDFRTTVSASFRRIVDLSDIRTSYSILPSGQSGQPMSRWYFDQYQQWAKGELKTVSMNPRNILQYPYPLKVLP